MLNEAEQTTQNIMTKYDNEVQRLTEQVIISSKNKKKKTLKIAINLMFII